MKNQLLRAAGCLLLLLSAVLPARGAEYFVSPLGSDEADGLGREKAFLTIQKGLDALQPGDTLTIGPGDYFESASRTGLGGPDADTTIRAEVPGTAVLRGDVAAPEFRKVDGYRFVYAAPVEQAPKAVIEHKKWNTLLPVPNAAELEFSPGHFFHDPQAKMLFISNPDLAPPDQRRYTLAVSGNNGLDLTNPRRVVIDGLAASGFYPGFGINLNGPESCTLRNCVTYLSVGGIRMGPDDKPDSPGGSNNLVENCVSFAHTFGGIIRYDANNDVIRNCRTFRSKSGGEHFGIMHYQKMRGPLLIQDNISWGQNFDYSVKPGGQQEKIERSVGLGYVRIGNQFHNLIGGGNEYDRGSTNAPADNILLLREKDLDRDFEFADPLNLDFRLQPDSRFRGSAPDGTDRGPFPYKPNIFYVSPDGNDQADGLSMRAPWRTLDRALKNLRPGDTLYLAEGAYAAGTWKKAGDGKLPVRICGRGRGAVVITSPLDLAKARGIEFERLGFGGPVVLRDSSDILFRNCTFFGPKGGLQTEKVRGIEVVHCVFADVVLDLKKTEGAILTGNLFANPGKPAVRIDGTDAAILHSDFNGFQDPQNCLLRKNEGSSLADLQKRHDQHSRAISPEFLVEKGMPRLSNPLLFQGLGPHSTAIGLHHDFDVSAESVDLLGPFLHSTSDTTANIEWWSSLPAAYSIAWGETPETTQTMDGIKGPQRYNSYSLTGLKPGQKYFFRIRKVEPTAQEGLPTPPTLQPANATLSFSTAPAPAAARVFYVAPDGDDIRSGADRGQAFRTVNRAAREVGPGDTVMIAGGEYNETVRIRATGTKDRPITFRSMPGERPLFKGENLNRAFELTAKSDIRFDGLYFDFDTFADVLVLRQSPRVQVTRCFNVGVTGEHSPGLEVRNCMVRGGWSAIGLGACPDARIENNVFRNTLLRQVSCEGPAVVKSNIFCECIRNKTHQTLLELGTGVEEANNCFYLRWPENEKLAINNLTLPEYKVRKGTDSIADNPMMPGSKGQLQGWPQIGGKDFNDFFTSNPRLILRGIGLQPDAFKDFPFNKDPWPFTKKWAEEVIAALDSAAALAKEGKDGEALAAYLQIAETMPLPDRLKADVFENASLCAQRLQEIDRAIELAGKIPVESLAVRRKMQILLDQGKYAELVETFSTAKLGGRTLHQGYTYPELEDLMADLFYYRSIAARKTGDLAAAEADLRTMNDKRKQLSYSSGESIHDLVWLRLGDFYRDDLKDDNRALEAYNSVIDRAMWTPFVGAARKPAASGADPTLAAATKAASDILRKQGREAEIPALELNLLMAQAEAAAALLKEDEMIAKVREALAVSGKSNPGDAKIAARVSALNEEAGRKVVGKIAGLAASGTSEKMIEALVRAAAAPDGKNREMAIRALLISAPRDQVLELLDTTEKEEARKASRAKLEPVLHRLRGLTQNRQGKLIASEFQDTDFAAWSEPELAGEAFCLRGQAFASLKDGTRAEADLKKALELQPGNSMALFALAENYRENLSDRRKALETYLQFHEANGVGYGWMHLDVALKAAELLDSEGRREEARQLLKKFDPEKAQGDWRQRLSTAITSLSQPSNQ